MLILNKTDLFKVLSIGETIDALRTAFASFSSGKAVVPERIRLDVDTYHGSTLFMPAYNNSRENVPELTCLKTVSVYPENTGKGLPTINSVILLLDSTNGKPIALIDGGFITAMRTGAAAGLATELLARTDSQVLAVFGAGLQAETQLEAVSEVRDIRQVWIYDPDRKRAERLVKKVEMMKLKIPQVSVADSPHEAVKHADIICTVTTSRRPVFNSDSVKPGVHINAIGSFTPDTWEIPANIILNSMLVVDSRKAALREAGDILHLINEGKMADGHIHAELGEIILGVKKGRLDDRQITVFKSVGIAVQDLFAAKRAWVKAREANLGQTIIM